MPPTVGSPSASKLLSNGHAIMWGGIAVVVGFLLLMLLGWALLANASHVISFILIGVAAWAAVKRNWPAVAILLLVSVLLLVFDPFNLTVMDVKLSLFSAGGE